MKGKRIIILLAIGAFSFSVPGIAEEITLTTYYPAPYGEYEQLYVSGNVGIGTTGPNTALDINGALSMRGMPAPVVSPSSQGRIYFDSTANRFKVSENTGSYVDLVGGFWAASGTNIYNTNTGNVGIGTTAPTRKLTVGDNSSTANNATLFLDGIWGNAAYTTHGRLYLNDKNCGIGAGDVGGGSPSLYIWTWSTGAADDIHFMSTSDGNQDPSNLIYWQTNMIIKGWTGNVGIGTTDPGGRLDVNGAIYQRGAVLHADYVFEPGYELESIEEHAEYMWREKRLKAIPKTQLDENGQEMVEIGADRKGILEELEKAHIYIQQLNERLEALEAKIKGLEG